MGSYILKKFATDQVVAGYEASILRYVQPSRMSPQQHADDVTAKSCNAADVYDEGTASDVFIKGVALSTRQSFRSYLATQRQADLQKIVFQAESLFAIQKGSGNQSPCNQHLTRSERLHTQRLWNSRLSVNSASTNTIGPFSYSLRKRSKSLPVMYIRPPSENAQHHSSTPTFSSTMLSVSLSGNEICSDPTYITAKCLHLVYHTQLVLTQS